MGFWTSYIGVGFGGELRPFASHGDALLFHPLVVVAALLVPALALAGFASTRALALRPVLPLLDARRAARHGRRLPRGDAAAPRR